MDAVARSLKSQASSAEVGQCAVLLTLEEYYSNDWARGRANIATKKSKHS